MEKKLEDQIIAQAEAHAVRQDVDPEAVVAALRKWCASELDVEIPERVVVVAGPSEMRALYVDGPKPKRIDIQILINTGHMVRACRAAGIDISDLPAQDIDLVEAMAGSEIYVMPDHVVFMRSPLEIHFREVDGLVQSHREDGPQTRWADGHEWHYIDDIRVPAWVATQTTATASEIMSIEDVDARARAIRKFGLGSLTASAKEIHEVAGYRLIDMGEALGRGKALYLEFPSLSVPGLIHVEGVDDSCQTVKQAIVWRAGRPWNPCRIDETEYPKGKPDQMQQGDVLLQRLKSADGRDLSNRLDRSHLLSAESQHRHQIVGEFELYGDDDFQTLIIRSGYIQHPEHGRMDLSGAYEVWSVREMDHLAETIRIRID